MIDFAWAAIAFGDVALIALAFALGFVAKLIGLPPLVGFLATGFLLNAYGVAEGELLQKMADLGITLLLFTVGLKLNLGTLGRPQVWAVTAIHMTLVVAVLTPLVLGLAAVGLVYFADLDWRSAALVAFALSFSSTVFAVKVLEERSETRSLHGRIAVGILIMQDIVAVVFLVLSSGDVPSPWALLLFLLIPLRRALYFVLDQVGHGELLVLYGFLLALGGAELFTLVGMKGDLGALVLGVMVAHHGKAEEMAKTMLGFKDLFLLGFFLSVGLSGALSWETLAIGALLTPLIALKAVALFGLLTGFNLRSRTALLATVNLTNFSEFGLIVAAFGVANGWLDGIWLTVLAIALSLSFAAAAVLNMAAHPLYARHRPFWRRFQRGRRLPDDTVLDLKGCTVAIIGMGGVGTGAYDTMRGRHGETVVGVDIDPVTVRNQQ